MKLRRPNRASALDPTNASPVSQSRYPPVTSQSPDGLELVEAGEPEPRHP